MKKRYFGKSQTPHSNPQARAIRSGAFAAMMLGFGLSVLASGCATAPEPQLTIKPIRQQHLPGTIVSASSQQPVPFETMMAQLQDVRVVYVGESHTNARHHEIQLKILKHLHRQHPDRLVVGMEMFARTYQDVLSQWSAGQMTESDFLARTHWYANWKYDFSLYRDLLTFIKTKNIDLAGLNVPFHIPGKIAAGGIQTLNPHEKSHLPDQIDMSDKDHREYVKKIYEQHAHGAKHYRFENFYAAQCVWEDAMAETVSRYLNGRTMVVFAGNGHITQKFGIPKRAYSRTGLSYKTVMPMEAGQSVDLSAADYIWVTPPGPAMPH